MQHVRARKGSVLAIATSLWLLGTSASFAQCMGGGGMASMGPGRMGGPRMMGMGGTGGASMMSMQQAMQMAQLAQQMRTMQRERLQMIEGQRNRQTAQPRRNRGITNRQVAVDPREGTEQDLQANTNVSPPQTASGAPRSQRNRRSAANRGN